MTHEVPQPRPARRGLSLSYRGKTLLSIIDPIAQSEKTAATYTVKQRTLYLVASPLFGYGIPVILNSLPEDSALIALEVDPALFSVTKEVFYQTIAPTVPYICIKTEAELCHFVRKTWGPRHFRRLELVTLNAGWTLYEQKYRELFHTLQQDLAIDWFNAMTLTRMGRLYARNTLRNLSALAHRPSLDQLSFGTTPVLVLGAGPSLDEFLDRLLHTYPYILNNEKRTFRIICVDTALQSCISRGIPVDLVVALEAQIWNLKDFIGYKTADFALAMDVSAHPDTIQTAQEKVYFFYTPWTELGFLTRLEQAQLLPILIPPLGSVGLTATSIALSLTRGPVYIAGLDFAFTPHLYHAKASPGYQRIYGSQNRLAPLSSLSAVFKQDLSTHIDERGRLLFTDRALQRYQELFIREFSGQNRLIDLRPWGLDLQIRKGTLEELIGHIDENPAVAAYSDKSAAAIALADNSPGTAAFHAIISPTQDNKGPAMTACDTTAAQHNDKVAAFRVLLTSELTSLTRLRAILSGEAPAAAGELDQLLDTCDYLWAHFPECAAAGRQRPGTSDISFLKRVRAELDYFIKVVETSLTHL
ncbi:6-hydroxymethylpterin diphosphokinase MptE-like protein [Gracilinema caldarium]|uniref:6-hydroxymethylpterin diphosphokinase MptE-like domain-containing protein n=1 Tax=Gracilinema caldarium (strain ATCC 51460 / DSM 7334 / H1) TaxID=744872 RepID=F8F097_GRAC1|nr:6-hydroxymethylpterin diphosphokinase MptE-like protein [Gracilinema caldarium]AEJ18961.1 protein of unknown function DUF115 [Gracilinema caldarium DSM 7334]